MITAEEILVTTKKQIISIDENATLYDALKLMVEHKIGAISVMRNGKIIGLWTERDLLRDILSADFDLKKAKISSFMLPTVYTAPHTTTLSELQDRFLGLYIRHLFVERDGEIIGLISSGDVMKAGLNLQTKEVKNLTSYVGLQYYENWKWPEKQKRI